MTTSLLSRRRARPAYAGAMRRSIAAAALLATSLFGTGAAQAALVVVSSTGTLTADTSASVEAAATVPAVNGLIDKTVVSQVFLDNGDGSLAKAFLDSAALPTQFFAAAESELQLTDGVTGAAEVNYLLNFTVTSTTQLSGTVGFSSIGIGDLLASFMLSVAGPGGAVILSTNAAAPDIDVLLTLQPGNYELLAQTGAANFNADNGISAIGFAFNLLATDVVDPPAAVPEPQSLALLLAALLATAATRRRPRT
jgi:hypothetical protein